MKKGTVEKCCIKEKVTIALYEYPHDGDLIRYWKTQGFSNVILPYLNADRDGMLDAWQPRLILAAMHPASAKVKKRPRT